jgi:UDP-glucose 4-epimerase
MMTSKRVLVTGSAGLVGSGVCAALTAGGDWVEPFDLVDGKDILNGGMLLDAARGVDVIVHLAALDDPVGDPDPELVSPNSPGNPEEVMTTTIIGTSNVLTAARMAAHRQVIVMSSIDALGVFLGHRRPDYLPIDDRHPAYPRTPYALAKRIAERQCREFTQTSGIATVCLRPAGVWTEDTIAMLRTRWARDPQLDHKPFWEYGAYIALEDLADLTCRVVHRPIAGHGVFNVAADDAALARGTSRQSAARIMPEVPWRGGPEFDEDPYRTLLDNTRAKQAFGWQPRVRFRPPSTELDDALPQARRPEPREPRRPEPRRPEPRRPEPRHHTQTYPLPPSQQPLSGRPDRPDRPDLPDRSAQPAHFGGHPLDVTPRFPPLPPLAPLPPQSPLPPLPPLPGRRGDDSRWSGRHRPD